jgi:uncharacterized protein
MTVRFKNVPARRLKAGPEDGLAEGEFIVYPSTFIRKADSYGDVVAPGAFEETIKAWKESGNVLPGLYGHRMDDPDYFVAGATDMGEDDHGWWVKGAFDMDSPKGPQTYRLAKGKRLNQLSFAYDVIDEGQVELEDGTKANELRQLDVYEFSFVPVGANQDTSIVAVKAIAQALRAGAIDLQEIKAAKAGRVLSAKNEDAIRAAIESLQGVLKSLGDDPEDDQTTEDDSEDQEKARGRGPAKDEGAARVKSQEPIRIDSSALMELELLSIS